MDLFEFLNSKRVFPIALLIAIVVYLIRRYRYNKKFKR